MMAKMVMLMLERWVGALDTSYEDEYMFGLIISILEVLVHAGAFWARLKQSEVLTSMVLKVQDAERSPNSMLKRKCIAIMRALACERHSRIPDPIDLHRMRSKAAKVNFADQATNPLP